jgi:hypothetical protein
MIRRDSVLRKLPRAMDRKQALFLDGIRHCGEIAGLAYSRLKETLTTIACADGKSDGADELYTLAFLDAWSLVDVIDRFRLLWTSLPHCETTPPSVDEQSFSELAQPVRNLRNVADHIAQRADYVVAHQGTALGILSWFTILKKQPLEGVICTIVPGTVQKRSAPAVNPAGREIEFPTGLVQLSAGEYMADLSSILPQMEKRINKLETALEKALDKQAPNSGSAGADFLLKMYITFP